MEIPSDLLKRISTPKARAPRSEREEMLDKFVKRLHTQEYPMTYGRLVKLFEGVPTSDLHAFYKICDGARSFGKMFWFKLKNNNNENNKNH